MGNRQNNEHCIFCDLLVQQKYTIMQNEEHFAFHDITKSSAQEHVLVCTKRHVKNAYQLEDPQQMHRMKKLGEQVLNQLCEKRGIKQSQRKFRFGFHLPPYNSVDHIHLHCFVEPFTSFLIGRFHFGYKLHSVQQTIGKWKHRKSKL